MSPSNARTIAIARRLAYMLLGWNVFYLLLQALQVVSWNLTPTGFGFLTSCCLLYSTSRSVRVRDAMKYDRKLFELAAQLRGASNPLNSFQDLNESDVIRLRDADRKVMAIKLYRKLHPDAQLREALDKVNAL